MGSAAPCHVVFSQTGDGAHVSCIGRWVLKPLDQQRSPDSDTLDLSRIPALWRLKVRKLPNSEREALGNCFQQQVTGCIWIPTTQWSETLCGASCCQSLVKFLLVGECGSHARAESHHQGSWWRLGVVCPPRLCHHTLKGGGGYWWPEGWIRLSGRSRWPAWGWPRMN